MSSTCLTRATECIEESCQSQLQDEEAALTTRLCSNMHTISAFNVHPTNSSQA